MDLTKITAPYGLLDPETQAALIRHGGPYEVWFSGDGWLEWPSPQWSYGIVYHVKPAALIPDSIDWSHVAPEFEWMARDENGDCWLYDAEPALSAFGWSMADLGADTTEAKTFSSYRRGTVDWRDSLVRRPE